MLAGWGVPGTHVYDLGAVEINWFMPTVQRRVAQAKDNPDVTKPQPGRVAPTGLRNKLSEFLLPSFFFLVIGMSSRFGAATRHRCQEFGVAKRNSH